jgi:hypothetical protein
MHEENLESLGSSVYKFQDLCVGVDLSWRKSGRILEGLCWWGRLGLARAFKHSAASSGLLRDLSRAGIIYAKNSSVSQGSEVSQRGQLGMKEKIQINNCIFTICPISNCWTVGNDKFMPVTN